MHGNSNIKSKTSWMKLGSSFLLKSRIFLCIFTIAAVMYKFGCQTKIIGFSTTRKSRVD